MPKLEFEKYTLPNGLQVILHVDRKLPIVHVNQWFHVGSKNEKTGRTGFAHLFEHMMFQGSKNASGEYFVYAEKAGANLAEGGVNGTTSNDRTNYFATVPSANLENLLWVESDRLATLLDATTNKKLDDQRDRREERAAAGTREPALRPLVHAALRERVRQRPSLFVAGDRQHGGSDGRVARRREGVLPAVLHAEQPVAGDRGRLRSGRGEEARREVLRRPPAWPAARSAGPQHRDARRRAGRRGQRPRLARARVHRLAGARVLRQRTTRRSTSPRGSSPTGCPRA